MPRVMGMRWGVKLMVTSDPAASDKPCRQVVGMQLSSHCTAGPAWVNAERGPSFWMAAIKLQQLAKTGTNMDVRCTQGVKMQQDTKA